MVRMHRNWELMFFFETWVVLLNDQVVGKLKNGKNLDLKLEKGDYTIQFIVSTFFWKMKYGKKITFTNDIDQNIQLNFKSTIIGGIKLVNMKKVPIQNQRKPNYENNKKDLNLSSTANKAIILSNDIHAEYYELVSVEEFPVDNANGSDLIFIEHEFSKTVTNEVQFDKVNELSTKIGIDLLKLFQMEISKNINHKIGANIGETISRKHTVSFNVKAAAILGLKHNRKTATL
jgi:hypothetical protein